MTQGEPLDTDTDQMSAFVREHIGWMIFNNPDRHNAITNEMSHAIPRILRRLQNDRRVGVIVMTGAGEKSFASGRDITQLSDNRSSKTARGNEARTADMMEFVWREIDKPIIAMIRGYCIGNGLQIAMKADVRVASEESKFGIPVAKLGRGAQTEGIEQLVSLVGQAWASEMLFSARHLSASEALRIGLVNRVVASDELEGAVRELAGAIASNAPLTLRQIKITLRELRLVPDKRDIQQINSLIEQCMNSNDYVEGKKAFVEKRSPKFQGH